MSDLAGLPGAERVERGIRDLNEGRLSTDALLAAVAAGRLRDLGLPVPEDAALPDGPDLVPGDETKPFGILRIPGAT